MTLGLVLTAFALGLRHGLDLDHVAAITDLTSSTERRRRALGLSTLYALGHALVVAFLGSLLLLTGTTVPSAVDRWMGRVVGLTLVGMAVWIIVESIRRRGSLRLRSRWMLVLSGAFAGVRRVRDRRSGRTIEVAHSHSHPHSGDETVHDHSHRAASVRHAAPVPTLGGPAPEPDTTTHSHSHRHFLHLADEPTGTYGNVAATGIGVIHGVGVETPTQIAAFVAATSALGTDGGLVVLATWIAGLFLANTALAIVAAYGVVSATRHARAYTALTLGVAVISLVVGVALVFDTGPLAA